MAEEQAGQAGQENVVSIDSKLADAEPEAGKVDVEKTFASCAQQLAEAGLPFILLAPNFSEGFVVQHTNIGEPGLTWALEKAKVYALLSSIAKVKGEQA